MSWHVKGVSTHLCKCGGPQSSHRYTAFEDDGKLVHGAAPFPNRQRPFRADVAQAQVEQLEDRLITGKQRPVLTDLT